MCTCAFSLSIFMSFLYTTINERLVVAQDVCVLLAYVTRTGTRCAPVPSRLYLHVLATQNKNERLVFTQGRDAHLCLLAFYLHVLIIQNPKRQTGSYSGTRCAPVPSRFLSSCRFLYTTYRSKTGSCSGTCASAYVAHTRDQMRTSAFSIFIFMSLLHKTKVRDW